MIVFCIKEYTNKCLKTLTKYSLFFVELWLNIPKYFIDTINKAMKRLKKVFLYKLDGVLKRPLEIAEYFNVSKNTINRLSNGLLVGDVESFEYRSKNNDLKGIVEVERFF